MGYRRFNWITGHDDFDYLRRSSSHFETFRNYRYSYNEWVYRLVLGAIQIPGYRFYQLFLLHFVLTISTVLLANWYFEANKLGVHFEVGYMLFIYLIIWIGMWWWERDDRRRINNQIKKRQRTD